MNRERQSPGRLFFLLAAKERTKENCRCFDAADPRLGGCTPLRTPKRKSEGAGAKRKQYYFSFLTPPPLPPPLSRGFPRTPAGVNGSSVGAAYMPPATYRGHPSTGKGGGLPPSLAPLVLTPPHHPVGAGHARPATYRHIPFMAHSVGRGLDPSATSRPTAANVPPHTNHPFTPPPKGATSP